jgi:hypothetical protein
MLFTVTPPAVVSDPPPTITSPLGRVARLLTMPEVYIPSPVQPFVVGL